MVVTAGALLCGCARKQEEPSKEGKETKPEPATETESRVKRGTNGQVTVTLDVNVQTIIGLRTEALTATDLSPELKAYGRVLDPGPLGAAVAEWVTAEAASQTSRAELTRLKTLAAQNNASERALQTAQATAVRDQAQLQAVRLRLMSSWGGAISQRDDLPDFAQSLGTLGSALVQLEVPAGQAVSAAPVSARLITLGNETNVVPAQWLGPAPSVDPQMQGRGFLFLVRPNPWGLAPGAAVTGWIQLPGEPRHGVSLPREAAIWFNGASWIYVQVSQESFERRQVSLGTPLEAGWFVPIGLKPGDRVVTVGAQQLLSEELKDQLSGD
jgi:hypothetical protein